MKTSTSFVINREYETHRSRSIKQPYEPDRYLPLSNALNIILCEFLNKRFKTVPPPGVDKLIFMPNDPNVIESVRMKHDCPKARRKPDIIGVFMSHLGEVDNNLKDKTFKETADIISEEDIEKNPKRPTKWSDAHVIYELKVKDRKMKMPECHWSLKTIVQDLSKDPEISNRKRTRGSEDNGTRRTTIKTKLSRVSLFPTIHDSILPDVAPAGDPIEYLTTEVQCCYYGMERLSCTWHCTHSIVVLLEGSNFHFL